MSSPRKRRIDSDAECKTPTKLKREELEERLSDSIKRNKAVLKLDWAELSQDCEGTEVESHVHIEMSTEVEEESVGVRTRSRKNRTPKRNADAGKPKFEKVLDLTAAMTTVQDERIQKLKKDKKRAEEGTPSRTSRHANKGCEDRKRQHSVSSVATNDPATPGSSRPRRKNARVDGTPTSSSRANSAVSSPRTPRNLSQRLRLEDTVSPKPKDDYVDPKLGWCEDEATLKRRTKEIEKAKEKDVYQRYCTEVQKTARQNGIHPRTPNKYINYSRRNWDAQIRQWKRALYAWAGESCPSSVNTSRASSVCEFRDSEEENTHKEIKQVIRTYASVLDNPDNMASLLGHFDMNTRTQVTLMADESTLKAANPTTKGPIDFSNMKAQ
ncbi:unnamed protein product [Bursaphelenchus xylophilus]|uniref:(pine wood nematode) hypothetical protein n=1 Tax=Bursaphelenchus xylophilus TaxID=6326 RepID=A0A1I7S258_BURXY|nr:unnamed protein product [Bursaphelenchus xylophilus]CAG9114886.1 unnamed protein product [Bursaphelenchus xylophilus]